jgi:hypothetical protein
MTRREQIAEIVARLRADSVWIRGALQVDERYTKVEHPTLGAMMERMTRAADLLESLALDEGEPVFYWTRFAHDPSPIHSDVFTAFKNAQRWGDANRERPLIESEGYEVVPLYAHPPRDEGERDRVRFLMEHDEKPLPCPFCGKEPYIVEDDSYNGCAIGCSCPPEPYVSERVGDLDLAIQKWNRRAE